MTAKTLLNTVRYEYDAEGKLSKKVVLPASGTPQTTNYTTDEDNNTTVSFAVPAPTAEDPENTRTVTCRSKADNFGRKAFDEIQLGCDFISRQYTYAAGRVTDEHKATNKVKSSPTTQLVSQIVFSGGRTVSYEYDEEERITRVTDSADGVTEYTYDALGQLLTEKKTKNGTTTVVNTMTYDAYGNITSRNGKTYTYGNTVWRDLLTAYNGQSIDYDFQGNPLSYLGHTLTWEKGRQLKSFDNNTYTYNANGIRTSKTVNGVQHTYTLEGTKILCEAWGNNTLISLRDNEDSVCGILYNNVPYYFQRNLQGDIIGILNKDAETVARYSYDAWGVCTSAVTSTELTDGVDIATINPFRYRGYYYDAEIGANGMYYLQSRYYDPAVGRFLNADEVSFICLTHHLISYSFNDPINYSDEYGYSSSSWKEDIKLYIGESWMAKIMNRLLSEANGNQINLIRPIDVLGFKMHLFMTCSAKNPRDKRSVKMTRSSLEANFKGLSFSLGWRGKLDATMGLAIGNYSLSFLRGIDWQKSYMALYISYTTKDGRMEFSTGLYISMSHLLKILVAACIVGACVLLPALTPVLSSIQAALTVESAGLVGLSTAFLRGMELVGAG